MKDTNTKPETNAKPETSTDDIPPGFGQRMWAPSPQRIENANLSRFIADVNRAHDITLCDYDELYSWSIEQPQQFWDAVWDFCGVRSTEKGSDILLDGSKMPGARWYPGASLNFAENLLRCTADKPAIIFRSESGFEEQYSYPQLRQAVAETTAALCAAGVTVGDRVAGYLPNTPYAVIAMLATASIGAVWSSSSPDFGVSGVLDRFGQIEPKVLFTADGYFYAGKTIDCLPVVAEFAAQLPSLSCVVVCPYTRSGDALQQAVDEVFPASCAVKGVTTLKSFTADFKQAELQFEALPFDHPLYIMYSSGTTGVPKCIVHGAGGTLLQHLKELALHSNVTADDRIFYFTTCGWMMWNWLVSALALEATLLLYDGSPFHPDGNTIFNFADDHKMTIMGTSAKFIDAANKAGIKPKQTHSLDALQAVLSTGSPLVPESFDYVYRDIKEDLCLSSISGGTDIISCFALGNPVLPVHKGELQSLGLGLRVEVFNDEGKSLRLQKGELVCTAPFPSMPTGFWNDPGDKKYMAAYFERFADVWCHGDYVALTENNGLIIFGRSDAVLNPGGVRIGTAEIYRQVEQLDEVVEALVVGQRWQGDVRVVLFVRLRDEVALTAELQKKIRDRTRENATPRHVPSVIVQVADIPRTKSGKIVELAVRNVIHGEAVKNKDALANPEALALFADLKELATEA